MEMSEINAYVRDNKGKSYVKKLRREKKVPGVIYGKNEEPVLVYFESKELEKLLSKHKGEHSLLSVKLNKNGKTTFYAIIKEVQKGVLTDELLHVDLHRVQMDKEIETLVPVQIIGSEDLKKNGAVVQLMIEELKIKTLPRDIPEMLSIDISSMNIGDKLKIKDVTEKIGYKILNDPEETILIIVHALKEEAKVPEVELKEDEKSQMQEVEEKI